MQADLRCFYSKDERIAVTGGSGYIGRSILARAESAKFEPCSFEALPDNTTVIHLAASVANDRASAAENFANDLWVIEAVRARHTGLVYASGNNVYPFALDCRLEEKTRCNDYYSAAKVVGEQLIRDTLHKPFSIVRIADVFGVGQRHGNLFRAIEKSLVEGAALRKYGAGLKRRSYIYAPELTAMLWHVATSMRDNRSFPDCFNACYADSASVAEIIDEIAKVSGLPVEHIDQGGADMSWRDIRTMTAGPFPEYSFVWPSFRAALADYVNVLANKQSIQS